MGHEELFIAHHDHLPPEMILDERISSRRCPNTRLERSRWRGGLRVVV